MTTKHFLVFSPITGRGDLHSRFHSVSTNYNVQNEDIYLIQEIIPLENKARTRLRGFRENEGKSSAPPKGQWRESRGTTSSDARTRPSFAAG